jgi:hypothetical protein
MKLIVTTLLLIIFELHGISQERIKLLNDVSYENIKINFSIDTVDHYVVTERVANISEGEIYWLIEEIDTITIKCLDKNDTFVTYEVSESDNDWMGLLYEREINHLINEKISFPKIRYKKNKITKNGFYLDSCQLSEFTMYHLNNRIKLLKVLGDFSHIDTYEKLIQRIDSCNANYYNYLQNSRNLIALDNYIIPIQSDTLKYEIVQLEHFGIKTKIAAYKTKSENGNNLIHLDQFEEERENKQDWNKIIDLYKDEFDDEQRKSYHKLGESMKSYNKATLELDIILITFRYFLMNRFLVFLLLIASCTDKGDSVNYIFKNISNKTFEVLMFNGLSIEFRSKLVINESTQLFTDKPPFEGPFSSIDSIKLIFEDEKKLIYIPLVSSNSCIIAEKNPYCSNFYKQCDKMSCTFEIDNLEYQKAK